MPKVDAQEPIAGEIVALDTETNGVDVHHGARPFFVTTCVPDGTQRYWEWDVDPLTRKVEMPSEDVREIAALVGPIGPPLVLQNGKFDAAMLAAIGAPFGNWNRVDDTLIAGHLLHSGQRHDLTSMVLMMLGEDIKPYEDALEKATKSARNICRHKLPTWRIAEEGLPEMPSAKGGSKKAAKGVESDSPWHADTWLPRAICLWADKQSWVPSKLKRDAPWWLEYRSKDHPWRTVLSEYANKDSESTLRLWYAQRDEIKHRGLWEVYLQRLKILPVISRMESRGVTISLNELERMLKNHEDRSSKLKQTCLDIAHEHIYDLTLPASASSINGSLRTFCFDVLKLPPRYSHKSKTGEPTLDKEAMAHYRATLDPESDAGRFVNALLGARKLDTGISYMKGYRRFALPVKHAGFAVLHPSCNPTGTIGLRFSMSNPNGQNVSTQEDDEGEGIRRIFGPLPGREWWALDYSNLELRIPAHEAGEEVMIELFENEEHPPYFGSYHLLVAHKLFPREFEEAAWDGKVMDGRRFKEHRKPLYKITKNTDLASQYGAQKATTDRTARREGAFEVLQGTFSKTFALAAKYVRHAEEHGYVETIPDRTVSERGFTVETQRSEWGRVSPTEPFNYHIQSTAGQAINKAMVRCAPLLEEWERQTGREHFIALQVHDELVFDFPAGGKRNLPKVNRLKSIMEQSGNDIGVPLKVNVSWHPRSWGEAVKLA